MSGFVSISTSRELYGSPAFLRVDYKFDEGRKFSKATVYSKALIGYLAISASLALLGGGAFAWPRESRDARVIFWIVFLSAAMVFSLPFVLPFLK